MARKEATPTPPLDDAGDDRPWLRPLVDTLWGYRGALRNGVLAAAAMAALIFTAAFLLVPADRFATLHFRVLFDGADQGKYPNDTPFSSAEIVATSVLEQVFKANELQRYMDFADFKASMFALESNPDLELLSYEYQTKLADPKLTPVDRARIEDEFKKKRLSLKSADYSLNFRRSERMEKLPALLVTKVLDDTLTQWARQAREQKGALKYDIPIFSNNILQRDVVAREDYLIAVDILRTKVSKILFNIDSISEVPGAALMRTGKSHLSLAEIRLNLEDLLRFDIEPSISLIMSSRLSKDPMRARMYLQDQLRQIVLFREQAQQRIKAVQDPLREYVTQTGGQQAGGPSSGRGAGGSQTPSNAPTMIPQFGESFLKQLVDMSMQNNDAKYRQELTDRVIDEGLKLAVLEKEHSYYQALATSLSGWVKTPEGSPESKALVARLDKSYETVASSLDEVIAIYDELSTKNLNPGTLLYSVTAPAAVRSERAISVRSLALLAMLAFAFSVVAIVGACLAHSYYRSEVAAHAPGAAPPSQAAQHETV
jgi:hypothetical protein